jgi:hypothetical protein
MSDDKQQFCRLKVPDGQAFRVTTRQKEVPYTPPQEALNQLAKNN